MPRRRVDSLQFKPQEIRKRVVLRDRDGHHIIVGIFDPSIHTMQEIVRFGYHGRPVNASLVKVTTRIIWYHEIVEPKDQRTFHPEQK